MTADGRLKRVRGKTVPKNLYRATFTGRCGSVVGSIKSDMATSLKLPYPHEVSFPNIRSRNMVIRHLVRNVMHRASDVSGY